MTDHLTRRSRRRLARALAFTPAVVLAVAAGPAFASPPQSWGSSPHVSVMHALLIYLIIPLSLIIVITLLVLVPSLVKGEKYQPGLAWHNEPEWFGGPRDGVAAAEQVDPKQLEASGERGGASAHW